MICILSVKVGINILFQYYARINRVHESVFKRSGIDPAVIATREDYGIPNEQLCLINEFADAKAAQGDYGPQVMVEMVNNMQAMAEHPWRLAHVLCKLWMVLHNP